jgi:hypothetical protein
MNDFLATNIDQTFQINESICATFESCNNILTDSVTGLSVLTMNIRSLNKNFDEFIIYLNKIAHRPVVIVLTETHSNSDTSYVIPNYHTCTATNNFINVCSGIAIFLREDYHYLNIEELSMQGANCLKIAISQKNKIYQLVSIYRTHSSIPSAFLSELRGVLNGTGRSFSVVLGDINIDISDNNASSVKEDYINIMTEFNYKSCINGYTRDVHNQRPSCIDHIWVNTNQTESIVSCIVQSDITDHYMCVMVYHDNKSNAQTSPCRPVTIRKINYELLKQRLQDESWTSTLANNDSDICAQNFENTLTQHINFCTTTREINNNSRTKKVKPWITTGLLIAARKKHKLFIETKKFPNNERLKRYYILYRNNLNSLIRTTKNKYYSNKLLKDGNNPKLVWNTLNQIMGRNKNYSVVAALRDGTERIDAKNEPLRCANMFCNFFVNIGKQMAGEIQNQIMHDLVSDDNANGEYDSADDANGEYAFCDFKLTNENEVSKTILDLKSGSSPGYDGIDDKLLKSCRELLSTPIAHIINASFETGKFPSIYKKTIITPIYKAGDAENINNYRPISLVSSIAKIYEKIVKKQLVQYLETHALLAENQYGFRPNTGTEDAIAKVTSIVMKNLDRGQKCLGIFIDLCKAFDSVSHSKLIKKLRSFGISGRILEWFRSYLTSRPQSVKISGKLSEPRVSEYGIPQGTVIGPVLFILYVDDMLKLDMNGEIISYADDTVVIVSKPTWSELNLAANGDVALLKRWFERSLLSLNTEKTNYILFSLKTLTNDSHSINIKICDAECGEAACGCTRLRRVESVKYLGIHIEGNMKWRKQIENTVKRIRKTIYILIRLREIVDLKTVRTVYFALVQSLLQYGIIGWGGTYKTNLEPLAVAQRLIIKIILKKPSDFATLELFKLFPVMNIGMLFAYCGLKQIKKELAKNMYEISGRPRTQGNIVRAKLKTSAAQHHYAFTCVKTYNSLPPDIKSERDRCTFGNKVKKYLLRFG